MSPIISSVATVLGVILIGCLCRWRGLLTESADQAVAKVITFVLIPAFFFDRILTGEVVGVETAILPPIVGFVTTASSLGFALLFARTFGPQWISLDTDAKQRAFALGVGICNYGYIPLPLAEQLYPGALVPLILHNVGVDLALWSVGVAVLCGVSGGSWRKVLINPPLFAAVIAVVIKAMNGASMVPAPLMKVANTLGDCAIPIGLLLSGALMFDYVRDFLRVKGWRGNARVFGFAILLRQGLLPLAMLGLTGVLIQSTEMRQVISLQAAMPSAIFPIILTRLYDKDASTALQVVLSTALAATVLIPLWLSIGRWWLGI